MDRIGNVFGELGRTLSLCRDRNWSGLGILMREDATGIFQFMKYGLCGAAAVIVHNVVFLGLLLIVYPEGVTPSSTGNTVEKNVVYANLIAFPVANIFAYLVNSKWVFTPGRHSPFLEFLFFTLISLMSFSAGLFGGPFLISEGLPVWIAQFGFIGTSALANFVCRKFFVFQR